MNMKVKGCSHETHRHSRATRLENALAGLKERGVRVTGPRREILRVLAGVSKPLSSDEVFAALKKGAGDLVTVYRSLATLEEIGLLRRHELGDSVRRYELAEDGHHHHYVRCRGCGNVEAFGGCEFEGALARSLGRRGYQMIQHNLDVLALCKTCQI